MKTMTCACGAVGAVSDITKMWVCSKCVLAGKLIPYGAVWSSAVAPGKQLVVNETPVDNVVSPVPVPIVVEVVAPPPVVEPVAVIPTKSKRRIKGKKLDWGGKTQKAVFLVSAGVTTKVALVEMEKCYPKCKCGDLRNLLYVTKHRLGKKVEKLKEVSHA